MMDLPFLFDADSVARVQELLGLGWPTPWRIVTLLGTNWGILLAVGVALWLWGRRVAYALLAVVAVDGILKTAINRFMSVPRPDGSGLVKYEQVDLGSFPSGHVSTATALWGYLSYRGHLPWTLGLLAILAVGVSRLYLGVHFIGDVLGGILLAVIVIGLVRLVWPPVRDWLARRSFGFWIGAAVLALAGVVAGAFLYFGTNPYQWRAGGLVAGLAIALPLEYRFIRYRPGNATAGQKVAKVLIGVSGIAVMAAVDQLSGERSYSLGLATTALAGIWAVLVAPTIFAKLGWSEKEEPRRDELVDRVAKGLAVATAVLALLVVYGMAIEPRLILDREEHTARIPGLPEAWSGQTVAVLSDFQVGLWLDNTGMMRRAVEEVVESRPAIAILAGDFVYHAGADPRTEVGQVMEILRPLLDSGIPAFAVLGNHDWGIEQPDDSVNANREAARTLQDSLTAAGVTILHNRSTTVPGPGGDGSLHVVGVGSKWMGGSSPVEAVDAVPDGAPRVVVMHHPRSFADLPAGSAPLAVAGHTHGGQVRIPLTPRWSWLTFTEEEEVHADGWIEGDYGAAGNRLYVTRGVGMSVIPMRINCPPEVTFFTLEPGEPRAEGDPAG